jgi:HSP20 family protein
MLLQRFVDNDLFSSLHEMQRIQQQLNRIVSERATEPECPPINVWASDDEAIIRAELPGIGPENIEITMVNDTLTVSASKTAEALGEGVSCQRQERFCGKFSRSLQMPFTVDSEKVKASFKNGILEINVPRAVEDKPRKIGIISE